MNHQRSSNDSFPVSSVLWTYICQVVRPSAPPISAVLDLFASCLSQFALFGVTLEIVSPAQERPDAVTHEAARRPLSGYVRAKGA